MGAAMNENADMLPEGLRDRLPPQAEAAAALKQICANVLAGHGYDLVSPPMVEFERSLAHRMQGVDNHAMARIVDPISKRTMAVRSDITVQVGRVATTALADAPRPLRLSYAGQVLRLSSDQLHPERERLQIGAELIGYDNVAAAQEILRVAVEALTAAGAKAITVDLTLPDVVDTLAASAFPLSEDKVADVRRELDTKDAGGLATLGASEYLPLLYAMGGFDEAIKRLEEIDAGKSLESRISGLKAVAATLPDDVTVTLDPTERHGFEYQSWFGFTLYAAGIAGPLGRGGSYAIPDGKGGHEVAIGFSLYPDPLLAHGGIIKNEPARRLFLPLDHNPIKAQKYRDEGWRTVAALDSSHSAAEAQCGYELTENGVKAVRA